MVFITGFIFSNQIIGQFSENDKFNYLDADYYYDIGDFKKAEELYLKLVKKYPDNPNLNYSKGRCYSNLKIDD